MCYKEALNKAKKIRLNLKYSVATSTSYIFIYRYNSFWCYLEITYKEGNIKWIDYNKDNNKERIRRSKLLDSFI